MAARPLSIFLLKSGRGIGDSIEESEQLEEAPMCGQFSSESRFFLRLGKPRKPWWLDYFGVQKDIRSLANGALVFIPTRDRVFALAFGSARHNLADDSYEHDFGTRVVLNCIDPEKLKSTDLVEPGSARRQRTQLPFDADLSYFGDLDDSTVLKSLTGKVGGHLADVARSVTGAYNLRVTADTPPSELVKFLEDCLDLSESRDYVEKFPTLRWLEPVTDPEVLRPLNEELIDALFDVEAMIALTIPDIVDYEAEGLISFAGAGGSDCFDDVYIKHYREYLEGAGLSRADFDLEKLKRHKLQLLNDDFAVMHSYSIFRSLVFEASAAGDHTFHLSDGVWYRVADDLLDRLRAHLEPHWRASSFPSYTGPDEGRYNDLLAAELGGYCLDKTSIAPPGEFGVEPCDVLRLVNDRVELIHVKIGTTSDRLSHHFNQGVNSLTLLVEQEAARQRLAALIAQRSGGACPRDLLDALEHRRFAVSFAIVTHKDESGRTENVPLFSRLSLRRQIRAITRTQTPASFEFVKDTTESTVVRRRRGRPIASAREVSCTGCHLELLPHLLANGLCADCRDA